MNNTYQKLRRRVFNAIRRCTDPTSPQWNFYGGRGIKIHQAWLDNPWLFIVHLTTIVGYDNPELWLDRINNSGNYEPGNLQFVTPHESALNRRSKGESTPNA